MHQTVSFVFPGQGSQYLGMLQQLAAKHTVVRQVFHEASDTLNYDLWQLIQQGPIAQLNQTEFTQPALLAAGVAMWRIWEDIEELQPKVLAGHSLGEYTALVCAGALSFAEALRLVTKRGQLMQNAVVAGTGAMAAILGLADVKVSAACKLAQEAVAEIVQPVNFNSPGQVVIAGTATAVNAAIEFAKEQGAKRAVLLPVSVPSHCALMQPIATQFALELAKINWRSPQMPVIHNFDVSVHQDPASLCTALEKQLYNPVRWVEVVQKIAEFGVTTIAECGPGKVLTSLNKRIVPDVTCIALEEEPELLEQALLAKV